MYMYMDVRLLLTSVWHPSHDSVVTSLWKCCKRVHNLPNKILARAFMPDYIFLFHVAFVLKSY